MERFGTHIPIAFLAGSRSLKLKRWAEA